MLHPGGCKCCILLLANAGMMGHPGDARKTSKKKKKKKKKKNNCHQTCRNANWQMAFKNCNLES